MNFTERVSLKNRLKHSIAIENSCVEDRFQKAKELFEGNVILEKVTKKERPVTKSFTLFEEEVRLLQNIRLELASKGYLVTQSDVIKMALKALNNLGEIKHELFLQIKKKE